MDEQQIIANRVARIAHIITPKQGDRTSQVSNYPASDLPFPLVGINEQPTADEQSFHVKVDTRAINLEYKGALSIADAVQAVLAAQGLSIIENVDQRAEFLNRNDITALTYLVEQALKVYSRCGVHNDVDITGRVMRSSGSSSANALAIHVGNKVVYYTEDYLRESLKTIAGNVNLSTELESDIREDLFQKLEAALKQNTGNELSLANISTIVSSFDKNLATLGLESREARTPELERILRMKYESSQGLDRLREQLESVSVRVGKDITTTIAESADNGKPLLKGIRRYDIGNQPPKNSILIYAADRDTASGKKNIVFGITGHEQQSLIDLIHTEVEKYKVLVKDRSGNIVCYTYNAPSISGSPVSNKDVTIRMALGLSTLLVCGAILWYGGKFAINHAPSAYHQTLALFSSSKTPSSNSSASSQEDSADLSDFNARVKKYFEIIYTAGGMMPKQNFPESVVMINRRHVLIQLKDFFYAPLYEKTELADLFEDNQPSVLTSRSFEQTLQGIFTHLYSSRYAPSAAPIIIEAKGDSHAMYEFFYNRLLQSGMTQEQAQEAALKSKVPFERLEQARFKTGIFSSSRITGFKRFIADTPIADGYDTGRVSLHQSSTSLHAFEADGKWYLFSTKPFYDALQKKVVEQSKRE
ncbi:hypothetical protein HYU06_06990 [Candidatus Woesearchaeota archaeon]|nr:hypothetical protein [Candidatus Woesearchaeota archaeon]